MSQHSVLSDGKASIQALEKALIALQKSAKQPRDSRAEEEAGPTSGDTAAEVHDDVRNHGTIPCNPFEPLEIDHFLPYHQSSLS
jgi:hypothetical protein